MHKAKACVVACMDFRFQDKIQKFLTNQGYLGECDEIIIAGGTRDFVTPVEADDGRYVWKQLNLSIKLHDPDEIVFIDHQDCGGYGQDDTIPTGLDTETDKQKHQHFFKQLEVKLQEKYPEKTVVFYYAPLEGEVE